MRRSVLFAATTVVVGLVYIGCTQDFDPFEPGVTFTSGTGTGGTGGTGGVPSSSVASLVGSGSGTGGNGGTGGAATTTTNASSSSSGTPGGCMSDSDCAPSTACQSWACTSGLCAFTNTSAGTPLPDPQQTPNDCKVVQCNGSGQEETVEDSGDTPMSDGKFCTDDICNGDMPEYRPLPQGTSCMGNKVCDGMGNCV